MAKGSWRGIAAVGGAVGLGVVAGVIALSVGREGGGEPGAPSVQAGAVPVVTVYKSPT